MNVRPGRYSDIQALRKLHVESGFDYDFPDLTGPMIEAIHVVEDDAGNLIAAVAAERIVQLYLFVPPEGHPAAKLHAIRILHQSLACELRDKGYHEVNAFLPPQIVKSFARRLMKMFGWAENWLSYSKGF